MTCIWNYKSTLRNLKKCKLNDVPHSAIILMQLKFKQIKSFVDFVIEQRRNTEHNCKTLFVTNTSPTTKIIFKLK